MKGPWTRRICVSASPAYPGSFILRSKSISTQRFSTLTSRRKMVRRVLVYRSFRANTLSYRNCSYHRPPAVPSSVYLHHPFRVPRRLLDLGTFIGQKIAPVDADTSVRPLLCSALTSPMRSTGIGSRARTPWKAHPPSHSLCLRTRHFSCCPRNSSCTSSRRLVTAL
jgi:hypothetical protein